jgi:hypothetical protein
VRDVMKRRLLREWNVGRGLGGPLGTASDSRVLWLAQPVRYVCGGIVAGTGAEYCYLKTITPRSCLCICLPIHLPTHPPTHPPTHLPTYLPTYLPTCLIISVSLFSHSLCIPIPQSHFIFHSLHNSLYLSSTFTVSLWFPQATWPIL